MPATLLAPLRDNLALYPPNQADAIMALYNSGATTLVLPVTFATADAAVLFTMPAGLRARITDVQWEVTTGFTGGASSAIGISSGTNAGFNTKGDLLGGAAGDLAAVLVAGFRGAVGTKLTSQAIAVLIAADTIRFDRIASAYTAGVANVLVGLRLMPTS